MDINKIQEVLPHRYPFLLIDRIISCEPDESAHAIKCVTINEPFFQGHFPGRPLMPGVLVVEAIVQAACYAVAIKAKEEMKNLSEPYNEDIKSFENLFKLCMEEIKERKNSGLLQI